MSEMTEERLAELRENRDRIRRQIYAMYGMSYEEDIADAVDEIDRLRAENDGLTAAHRFLLASSYCREEMDCLAAGPLDLGGHDRFCAVRIAYDALNPEQTS